MAQKLIYFNFDWRNEFKRDTDITAIQNFMTLHTVLKMWMVNTELLSAHYLEDDLTNLTTFGWFDSFNLAGANQYVSTNTGTINALASVQTFAANNEIFDQWIFEDRFIMVHYKPIP